MRIILITSIVFFFVTNQAWTQEKVEPNGIQWMSFEEAFEASSSEPKMWLLDMYTDWCGWCKRMDASTFKDSLIVEFVNEHYYAVKFDAEQKEDITVGGKVYSFVASGRRGYHELAAELMGGKMSYPTFVFLTEEKQILTTVAGFKEAPDFLPILEFCAGYDATENPTGFKTFLMQYESPYGTDDE